MANNPFMVAGIGKNPGRLESVCTWRHCRQDADPSVPVPVGLCLDHWAAVGRAAAEPLVPQLVDARHRTAPGRRLATKARPRAVVYYVRFGDRVKIGTTTNMAGRLLAVPFDEVLAVEPGSYALERLRHRQFAATHLGREWFAMSAGLQRHVATVCAEHPLPDDTPTRGNP